MKKNDPDEEFINELIMEFYNIEEFLYFFFQNVKLTFFKCYEYISNYYKFLSVNIIDKIINIIKENNKLNNDQIFLLKYVFFTKINNVN